MQRRLDHRLERAGLDAAARGRILDVTARAIAHRIDVLGVEAHFEALHPARTLLILLDDCDVRDVALLEAAGSIESEHDELRIEPPTPLARAVPTPQGAGDALVEELVVADEPARLIALAERLDHARHLHLRDRACWTPFHESIGGVYLPVAERSHARLAQRYAWWWETFRRRFIEGGNNG